VVQRAVKPQQGSNPPVAYAFNASAEIAAAALYPLVRVFTVGTYDGGSPVPLPQLYAGVLS